MQYLNQLEPNTLIQNFISNPPVGFDIKESVSGLPIFRTKFNLLTTVDQNVQKRLSRLPLFRYWQRLLQIETGFIGTTVSEYTLLPTNLSASVLATHIKNDLTQAFPLLIVKDIPQNSPLLDDKTNLFSDNFISSLKAQDFICISGQALAWVPIDFNDLTEYLSRLSSGRRKDMRRKLKKKSELDIQILHTGDDHFNQSEVLENYYNLYMNVYQQSEVHFDLLSQEFFTKILQDKESKGIIFTYKHSNKLIGYNICYVVGETLIDKYVGFEYPAARDDNLYFISWFHNLEYALQHKLKRYIAGWTDPEIKAYLGAQFTFTRHAVYVRNPVLRTILRRFSPYFESDQIVMEKITHSKK